MNILLEWFALLGKICTRYNVGGVMSVVAAKISCSLSPAYQMCPHAPFSPIPPLCECVFEEIYNCLFIVMAQKISQCANVCVCVCLYLLFAAADKTCVS